MGKKNQNKRNIGLILWKELYFCHPLFVLFGSWYRNYTYFVWGVLQEVNLFSCPPTFLKLHPLPGKFPTPVYLSSIRKPLKCLPMTPRSTKPSRNPQRKTAAGPTCVLSKTDVLEINHSLITAPSSALGFGIEPCLNHPLLSQLKSLDPWQ